MNEEYFDEQVLRRLDDVAIQNTARFQTNSAIARLPETTWLERRLKQVAVRAPYGVNLIDKERPYLLRVYLRPERPEVGGRRPYLHYFYRGDDDRAWHNHPWGDEAGEDVSTSLILTGGYVEERLVFDPHWDWRGPASAWIDYRVETKTFKPWSINRIARNDFHKVRLLDERRGCWTLFWSARRAAPSDGYDWGFKDIKSNYEPWGEHHRRKYGVWPKVKG